MSALLLVSLLLLPLLNSVQNVRKRYHEYTCFHDFPIQFEERSESISVEITPQEKDMWQITSFMDSEDTVVSQFL